ncbi:MAG: hypothetical protein FWC23_07325 [Chitinispirillia bacterium]|nr:hypothetical protein [Chitinispirillia bacterium]MCL2268979.1 hypothetical protein [Chitinispirillia bacterium]
MSIEFLTELEDKINNFAVILEELKAENAALRSENDNFKAGTANYDGLKGEVESLRGNIGGLNGQIDALRGEKDGLTKQLEELRADADGQRAKMSKASARIREMLAKVESLR